MRSKGTRVREEKSSGVSVTRFLHIRARESRGFTFNIAQAPRARGLCRFSSRRGNYWRLRAGVGLAHRAM